MKTFNDYLEAVKVSRDGVNFVSADAHKAHRQRVSANQEARMAFNSIPKDELKKIQQSIANMKASNADEEQLFDIIYRKAEKYVQDIDAVNSLTNLIIDSAEGVEGKAWDADAEVKRQKEKRQFPKA